MINQLIINLFTSTLSKKKLIILICILLTSLLSGCVNKKVTLAESCVCLMQYQTDYNGDYYGEKKDGIRHGQGEMIWTDGLIYKGEWQNGEPHGQGRITDTAGSYLMVNTRSGN